MDEPDRAAPEVTRRRLLTLGAAGGAALAIGGGVTWRLLAGSAPTTTATGEASPTTTSATVAPTTETTLPPLPVADPPPEDPHAPTPVVVLGTLAIPRIHLTAQLQEGITLTAINRGPGHWPGTAMPGELGNVVVAGHRTLFDHPFRRLDELQPGDPVVFTTASGPSVYVVRGVVVVDAEAIDIAAQSRAHTATLFACHPIGSAAQRIVAKLRLVATGGVPVDPDAALPPVDAGTQAGGHTLLTRRPDPLSATGQ